MAQSVIEKENMQDSESPSQSTSEKRQAILHVSDPENTVEQITKEAALLPAEGLPGDPEPQEEFRVLNQMTLGTIRGTVEQAHTTESLCPQCAVGKAETANYCSSCGSPIFNGTVHETARCPRCLTEVSAGSRFCSACGLPLDGEGRAKDENAESGDAIAPLWRRILGVFSTVVLWIGALAITLSVVAVAISAGIWYFGYAQAVDLYVQNLAPVLAEVQALDKEIALSHLAAGGDLQHAQATLDDLDAQIIRSGDQGVKASGIYAPTFLMPIARSLAQALQYRQQAVRDDRAALQARVEASRAEALAADYRQIADWYSDSTKNGLARDVATARNRTALDKEKSYIEESLTWQQAVRQNQAHHDQALGSYQSQLKSIESALIDCRRRPTTIDEYLRQIKLAVGIQ